VQLVGALAWGPNTLNVMVPLGADPPVPPPERVLVIELAEMALLVAPVAGPLAEVEVAYFTVTGLVKPVVAVQDEWYLAVILYS
jgi:hypothetical protein